MNAKQRQQLRQVLFILAGVAVFLPFFLDTADFPMREESEIKVKLCLALAALAVVVASAFERRKARRDAGAPAKVGTSLALMALVAALGYFNFGAFHGLVYNHFWEQFHYVLGAKYFPELGYDGLYAASLEAQSERNPPAYGNRIQPLVRDLRTNEVVSSRSPEVLAHRAEVKERFTPERWRQFRDDNYHFLFRNSPGYIGSIRRDHGFNPPPSWTFVARLFTWAEVDDSVLVRLANIDVLLLITMFVFVFRTYGSRLGCLALIVFGLNYAGRYYWVGGAFLREDWLACSVIGVCMLKREKYLWAGGLIGWATAVRVFPVLFLLGPAVLGLRALVRREKLGWAFQIVAGFAVALLLAVGLGSLTGRGFSAWGDFAEAITLHRGTWLTNNVGLDNVLLYDRETMTRELVNFRLPEPWIHWQAKMDRLKEERRAVLWAAKGALMLLVMAACWRARREDAAIIGGVTAIFALVVTTCYYWQMLLLLPLTRSRVLLYGILILNLGMMGLHFQTPAFEMRYGLFSWGLLVLFLAYLLPLLWRQWRLRATAETGSPEAVES